MTIHSSHPFHDPVRDPARQFRARLGSRVSLWTSGELDQRPAGLTVSSMVVAGGEPWRVLALLDPAAEFTDALLRTGTAVVTLLNWHHRHLAEVFAGLAPSPGGPFRAGTFVQESHGPRPAEAESWASVGVEATHEVGWSLLVTCTLDHVELGEDESPLHHVRGRYVTGFGSA